MPVSGSKQNKFQVANWNRFSKIHSRKDNWLCRQVAYKTRCNTDDIFAEITNWLRNCRKKLVLKISLPSSITLRTINIGSLNLELVTILWNSKICTSTVSLVLIGELVKFIVSMSKNMIVANIK